MDKSDIDLFALRSFCVLMDERSVSRAAARLGLGQSGMSRQLAQLRAYFADPLLVWAGGTMVPTPRALALRDDLRQVVEKLERLSSPAQAFDPASTQTTVVLAATGYMERIFLADVMNAVAACAPGVRVKVRLPDRQQDVSALGRGEIDFLIGWMTNPAPTLRSRLLFKDKLVCIARAAHPKLRDGDGLTYAQYLELPHIQYDIPGKTTTERLLQERLSREGHQQNIKYHVQSPLTVAEIVANSDVIATVPGKFAARCREQFLLQTFDLPFSLPPMQNRAYWHECMHSDARSRWFRRLLVDAAKSR
ncbi:MAG: transcriptional regulator, LysR family [Gammaproteobacteria bacterium]|nr:transcriptional regulator, LysR family [Gammaproteobacteria bacterium]